MLPILTLLTKKSRNNKSMKLNCPLVLASASPRRKKLLEQLGLSFEVQASNVDESFNANDAPQDIVQHLAAKKSRGIDVKFSDCLILSADTIVVLDRQILGKPASKEEACRMLTKLSGKQHEVFTGIALSHPASNRFVTNAAVTRVTFAQLTEKEILSYVATGSPMDKAGAYGIQDDRGALFISSIQGDYYNVVGLPLYTLYSTLKRVFDDLLTV